MHEMSIAIAVLEGACEAAAQEGGRAIAAGHLRVGVLSGVDPEALVMALSIAAEGTRADGARWAIKAVEARGWCGGCQALREPVADYDLRCRNCGAELGELREGRELELTAIELEAAVQAAGEENTWVG